MFFLFVLCKKLIKSLSKTFVPNIILKYGLTIFGNLDRVKNCAKQRALKSEAIIQLKCKLKTYACGLNLL